MDRGLEVGIGLELGDARGRCGRGHAAASPRAFPASIADCPKDLPRGAGERIRESGCDDPGVDGPGDRRSDRNPRDHRSAQHVGHLSGTERSARLVDEDDAVRRGQARRRDRPTQRQVATTDDHQADVGHLEHRTRGRSRSRSRDRRGSRRRRRAVPHRAPHRQRPTATRRVDAATNPGGAASDPATTSTASRSRASVGASGPAASQSRRPVGGSEASPSIAA